MKENSNWKDWNLSFKEKKLTQKEKEILELFQKNYSIEKIAQILKVKPETIERKILILITKSFISIKDVMDVEKFREYKKKVKENINLSLKEIKKVTNDELDWFEIKAIIAHYNSKPIKIKNKD